MSTTPSKARSPDPRSRHAVANLLVTAEKLFAQRGIDNVSLREIANATGSRNNNIVQYHFGSKEQLLAAIFRHRIEQMEERRAAMLLLAEKRGSLNRRGTLLEILCLPHLDLADEHGRHPYAGFLLQYARQYWRVNDGQDWTQAGKIGPNLHRTSTLLLETLAPLRRDVARTRIQLCNFMFLDALLRWDQVTPEERPGATIFLTDALSAAKAALGATGASDPSSPGIFQELFPDVDAGSC